jgi:autotransporter-associated beta strand protein
LHHFLLNLFNFTFISLFFANQVFAQAFLDFNDGLTGWTTFGNSSSAAVQSSTVSLSPGGVNFSLTPPAGQKMVQLQPGGSSIDIGNIDATLDLSSGTMLSKVGSGAGPAGSQLTTKNYGGIKTTRSFAAGTYSFAWAYSSGDYLPYTDGAFFSLAGSGTSSVTVLARNGDTAITPGSAGYPIGTTILDSYGSTTWATNTFLINTAGNYTIGFGAFNALDDGLNPFLFIASIPGTSTGTPAVTSMGNITSNNILGDILVTVQPVFSGGTLTLLNSQSSGQNFTITSSGTVNVASGSATLSGNITNASGQIGSLFKTGAGALTLSGTNTYSGGTTVSQGSLIGNTASLQGAITNNGTVIFNQSSAGNYSGAMSGIGALNKTGAGALTLSGTNTYTGGTTVSQGSLIGNTASLQGAITNNGTVIFNQSSSGNYSGAMSGTGKLIVSGNGGLTLSNTNTHSGGTEVQAGANLQIASPNALGSGTVALIGTPTTSATLSTTATMTITNPITVAYDPTFNVAPTTINTVAGVISDGGAPGDVVVTGGGTLALTNVNTYSGLTTIDIGSTLALVGSGSITNSTPVTNNGTFDIAGSLGNVTLGGSYTQGSTGTLQMGFSPSNNQQLNVTGAASLSGGLSLLGSTGRYTPGRYRLINAGSVSGTFGSLSTDLGNYTRLGYSLAYDGLGVYLLLTSNPLETQQSLVNTSSVLQGTFTLQNSVMVNGFTYDCAVFDMNGFCISVGGRNTSVQAQGINNTSGLLIASYRLSKNNTRIGAWLDQNLSMSGPGAVQVGNATPMIGLFGVWSQRPDGVGAEVRVSAAYGQKDLTVTRQVVGTSEPGTGGSQLITQGAQAVGKYGFAVMSDVVVSPYAGIRYAQNNMGGYTEALSSSVTSPLTYAPLNTSATTALAGAEAHYRGIPKITLLASAGVEMDTNTANGTYSATGLSGLTPINFNPNPVKTRPTATLGAYYDLTKNQRFGVTGIYRQEAYQAVSTTTVMATYTIGL